MEKACKLCRFISKANKCPACGGDKLTDRWNGIMYIVDPENSEIAKKLGLKTPGRYAAKIRD